MEKTASQKPGGAELDPRTAFDDTHAARWEEMNPELKSTLRRFEAMKAELALNPGNHVLELGCGPGQYTAWLCEQVKPGLVTATDFSPAMIAEACKQVKLSAEFMVSDICQEAPGVHAYHTVFCYNAFPHFRDKKRALANISKSLKSKGTFVILHFCSREALNAMHSRVGGAVEQDFLPDRSEMKELLSRTGFEVLEWREEPELYFIKALRK